MLREAFFINGVLTNLEVCYGLTDKEINDLEKADHMLLRRILAAHSKTAIEALYLELGCIPLRFLIISRRIMYFHHILLSRPKNSLIRQIFNAQEMYPVKNDWVLTI